METFPAVIDRYARLTPEKIFLREKDRSLSYEEAAATVERLAAALSAEGLKAGDRCVILMENGLDYALAWMALARLGVISVLINQAYFGAILEHQVRLVKPRAFIVDGTQCSKLGALEEAGAFDRAVVFICQDGDVPVAGLPLSARTVDLWHASSDTVVRADMATPDVGEVMSIFYTSGTTGPSKAVAYTHAQAWQTAQTVAQYLDASDVFYMTNPMCHVSLPHCLGAALLAGGTLVVRPKFSASSFWDDVRRYGATVTMMLGSVGHFVSSVPPSLRDRDHTLRKVLMVPLLENVAHFCERFNVEVMSWFNMTEVSVPLHTRGFSSMPSPLPYRPRAGAQVRVVDERDRPVPVGTPGELLVRDDSPWLLSTGYWNNPDATVAAWRNLWFHTGDLFVECEPGSYRFLDRLNDRIRRRGENIASFEIEQQMLCNESVAEAAVVGVPADDGEQEVLAIVALKVGATLTPVALLDFLRERVPHFCVPRYVLIQEDPLAKTPTGKITKSQLRECGVATAWDREQHGYRVRR